MLSANELETLHRRRSGSDAAVFRAPGRVNLLGEHTDYSGGFCMPAALNFATLAAVSPRTDAQLIFHSLDYDETASFSAGDLPARGRKHWSDYPAGVAWALQQSGIQLPGADLTFTGDVPQNSGLSSSAAIEVATALALLSLTDSQINSKDLALLCQKAENGFVGAPSGVMDQFISLHGRAHCALALDCRNRSYEYAEMPANLRMVIVNSMVKHSVAGGEYRERREQIEDGVRILQREYPHASPPIRELRDVSLEQLQAAQSKMPDVIFRRCRHVITDSARVLQGVAQLREGEVEEFGKTMVAAHESYRNDFEGSCRECDLLVELALSIAGCYGSRLTGGGFGGCTVSLVEQQAAEGFRAELVERYKAATGIAADSWITEAAGGAHRVTG